MAADKKKGFDLNSLLNTKSKGAAVQAAGPAQAQIGGAEVLTALPGSIKAILQRTTDLKAKTEMLEAIAEIKAM